MQHMLKTSALLAPLFTLLNHNFKVDIYFTCVGTSQVISCFFCVFMSGTSSSYSGLQAHIASLNSVDRSNAHRSAATKRRIKRRGLNGEEESHNNNSSEKVPSFIAGNGDRVSSQRHNNTGSKPPAWRKILYENQPFEDNYVDPLLFLNELRRNSNVTPYRFEDVVMDSIAISQNISVVVQFILMFSHVFSGAIQAPTLVLLDCCIFLLTLLWYMVQQDNGKNSWQVLLRQTSRQVLSLGPMLLLMSPLLSDLTVSYSNDTIVAMSVLMMTLHVMVTDYRYLNAYTKECDQSFAVNSATFGVVLMVSRIPRGSDGVALLMFGTICFSLSPFARHSIRCHSFRSHAILSAVLTLLVLLQLVFLPVIFLIIYVMLMIFLTWIIPWCFVRLHESWKVQINGPWDEAKPTNSAAAAEWANSGLLS